MVIDFLGNYIFLMLTGIAQKGQNNIDLIELVPLGIIILNYDGEIILINQLAINLLDISVSKTTLHQDRFIDFIGNLELLNKLWKVTKSNWTEFDLKNISIKDKQLDITGRDGNGSYVINIIDNTDTIKALDQATQSLLIGQENEKRRISREIHDGIGQAISTVKLHLDFIISKADNVQMKRDVGRVNEMVSEIATDLRNLSHDLLPSSLVDFGLVTTISNLAKRINRTKTHNVVFVTDLDDKQIALNYTLNIYRIVQELINNSIKHAQINEVNVELNIVNKHIVLKVWDEGKGSSNEKSSDGLGLYNIKNRLTSLNAVMKVVTAPNAGFKIKIKIPYNTLRKVEND